MLFCHEDGTKSKHGFDDDLGDYSAEEVSFWEYDNSDDDTDDDADEVDIKEDVLFVCSYEEVVEYLFDETEY